MSTDSTTPFPYPIFTGLVISPLGKLPATKAAPVQSQLLDSFSDVKPFMVDRLSDGGLFRKGVHVPCMEGFSVCQNCLIFCTFTPDSCLSLSTHSSISSGVLFFTSTTLLLPFTKMKNRHKYLFRISMNK